MGDWWPITSSGAGNGGGTTAVFSSLIGLPSSSIDNLYLLQVGATNTGEWRRISSFDPATGTITVVRAFTAQTATAEISELHVLPPNLYTLAGNEAMEKAVGAARRVVEGHYTFPDNWSGHLPVTRGVPRNMRDPKRLVRGGTAVLRDDFNRADSTTEPGESWVESAGNWGRSSERLYSVSDTNADFVTWDAQLNDGYLKMLSTGTTNHATVYRTLAGAFRIRKDYLGAFDLTTCLLVRLLGTSTTAYVDLRKNDGGTETSLATGSQTTVNGTYYQTEVKWEGNRVNVWVDGVQLISHQLTGVNEKYLDYGGVGVRLDKAGSPGTDARLESFYAYALHPAIEESAWRPLGDHTRLEIDNPSLGSLYVVEGDGAFTPAAADTFELLVSDTTAVYEIAITDQAWPLIADAAAALMMKHGVQPANVSNAELRAGYAAAFPFLQAEAIETRKKLRQPMISAGFRHP